MDTVILVFNPNQQQGKGPGGSRIPFMLLGRSNGVRNHFAGVTGWDFLGS